MKIKKNQSVDFLCKQDSRLSCWDWIFTNSWSIFLKMLPMAVFCLVGSLFFDFLWHFCGILYFFMTFFLLKFQTQLLSTNLSFSRRCFDTFFEPPQSNQTKYSILMPQQANEHKNCAKQKFYIYRLIVSVSASWNYNKRLCTSFFLTVLNPLSVKAA